MCGPPGRCHQQSGQTPVSITGTSRPLYVSLANENHSAAYSTACLMLCFVLHRLKTGIPCWFVGGLNQ